MFALFMMLPAARDWSSALAAELPGLQRAHVYTPGEAHDPFLKDGPPPPLVLQLYFRGLPALESAAHGALHELGEGCRAQAMAVRPYSVPEPGVPGFSYLVGYDGPAEDEQAWLGHYLAHHIPLMAALPGIRELEVYTRVDWIAPTGWIRVDCMQRNKVAFDSAAALSAALESPVRRAMREDFARLPRFSGAVTHYAMWTRVVDPTYAR